MAGFKCENDLYLTELQVFFWRNLVKNFRGRCEDEDFFLTVAHNFPREEIIEQIRDWFAEKDLNRLERRAHGEILEWDDSVEFIFKVLWNDEVCREKCRELLLECADVMLEQLGGKCVKSPLKRRLAKLKRQAELSSLELELIALCYVAAETAFEWPRRLTRSVRPLYLAASLDRSVGEVSKLLAVSGRLLCNEFLDKDWRFNRARLGDYLLGIEKDAIRPFKEDVFHPAKGYSLDGLNIKGKIGAERIVRSAANFLDPKFNAASEDKPRMNILLFGPPGSGKTEFVKFLGQELKRKVMVVNGSDVMSRYVGETEKRISEAFKRAEKQGAILFFDEIDGLVADREQAEQRWEVTQVNEILQRMENFNGILVAATNFMHNLDAAILRRFTFKLEFDYLDRSGRKIFFEKMFKTELSADEGEALDELETLTPGDFRTVRQELFYLEEEQNNENRLAALRNECELKREGRLKRRNTIGFCA